VVAGSIERRGESTQGEVVEPQNGYRGGGVVPESSGENCDTSLVTEIAPLSSTVDPHRDSPKWIYLSFGNQS